MMIRMVSGWVFLLAPAHPGSPGQRAVKRLLLLIIRPHRSTTYMDAAYFTDRVVYSVHMSWLWALQNSWTNRDAICVMDSGGSKEPCIRWGSRSPMGRGNFVGEWAAHCKYREYHPCAAVMWSFVKLLWPLVKAPTTPYTCCYTTLWNISVWEIAMLNN